MPSNSVSGLPGCAAASVILFPPLSSQREGVRNSKDAAQRLAAGGSGFWSLQV